MMRTTAALAALWLGSRGSPALPRVIPNDGIDHADEFVELVRLGRRLRVGLQRNHKILPFEPHIERSVAERLALVEPVRAYRSENSLAKTERESARIIGRHVRDWFARLDRHERHPLRLLLRRHHAPCEHGAHPAIHIARVSDRAACSLRP